MVPTNHKTLTYFDSKTYFHAQPITKVLIINSGQVGKIYVEKLVEGHTFCYNYMAGMLDALAKRSTKWTLSLLKDQEKKWKEKKREKAVFDARGQKPSNTPRTKYRDPAWPHYNSGVVWNHKIKILDMGTFRRRLWDWILRCFLRAYE